MILLGGEGHCKRKAFSSEHNKSGFGLKSKVEHVTTWLPQLSMKIKNIPVYKPKGTNSDINL